MFAYMQEQELQEISGGGWGDVFEKVNPFNIVKWVYDVGKDMGKASVQFGRNIANFAKNFKINFGN